MVASPASWSRLCSHPVCFPVICCLQLAQERYNGRHLQRLVHKLAGHSWQLMYEGFAAAVAARADCIQQQLLFTWQLQQSQLQQAVRTTPVTPSTPGAGASQLPMPLMAADSAAAPHLAPHSPPSAAAAAAADDVQADGAGHVLSAVEAGAGALLSDQLDQLGSLESDVLLAATRRGLFKSCSLGLKHLQPHCVRRPGVKSCAAVCCRTR